MARDLVVKAYRWDTQHLKKYNVICFIIFVDFVKSFCYLAFHRVNEVTSSSQSYCRLDPRLKTSFFVLTTKSDFDINKDSL